MEVSKFKWIAMHVMVIVSLFISMIVICWAQGINERMQFMMSNIDSLKYTTYRIDKDLQDECRARVKYLDALRRDLNSTLSNLIYDITSIKK